MKLHTRLNCVLVAGLMSLMVFAATVNAQSATVTPTPADATAESTREPSLLPLSDGLRVRGESSPLNDLDLVLRRAEIVDDQLVLTIGFENIGDERLTIIGSLRDSDFVLLDASGTQYEALEVDEGLSGITADNGSFPGASLNGQLTFDVPDEDGTYTLQLPRFEPLDFEVPYEALVASLEGIPNIADGEIRVVSTENTLDTVELVLRNAELTETGLTLDVAFVNTSTESFRLIGGLREIDIVLLNATRSQINAKSVDENLLRIAPANGFVANGANEGQIVFPVVGDRGVFVLYVTNFEPIIFTVAAE